MDDPCSLRDRPHSAKKGIKLQVIDKQESRHGWDDMIENNQIHLNAIEHSRMQSRPHVPLQREQRASSEALAKRSATLQWRRPPSAITGEQIRD